MSKCKKWSDGLEDWNQEEWKNGRMEDALRIELGAEWKVVIRLGFGLRLCAGE